VERREFLKSLGAGTLSLAVPGLDRASATRVRKGEGDRPSVVLILTDDQGLGDLGCLGNPILKTPNLDVLHAQAARFTDFHVDPTCSPTRASLLTGRYSSRVGVWHTIMGRSILPKDEVTMAAAFSRNGYRTGIFGKWHLGDNFPFRPQECGFDEAVVIGGGAIGNMPDYWGNDYFDDTYRHNGRWQAYEGYCTDVFFDEAMAFMARGDGRPFFVYLPTNVPHWPHHVAEAFSRPYRGFVPDTRATLYGMLANLDVNVGRLLRFLRETGLEDDTILIFLSDNGTAFGAEFDERGFVVSGFNAGLRGEKGTVYEGGHRVACFVRWPAGGVRGGRDIPQLAAHIDLFPTLVDLCGLEGVDGDRFDGASLAPLLSGRPAAWPARTLLVHNQRVDAPIKGKDYVVMREGLRLVNGRELYDVKSDPGQRSDISGERPRQVAELREAYERWWDHVSGRFGQTVAIPLGAEGGDPAVLTSHDIHGQVCWDQSQARRNSRCDGFWEVEITSPGTYDIAVSRWPEEAGLAIGDVPEGGKAMGVTHARLLVGGVDVTRPVREGERAVVFSVPLRPQRTRLQAWLVNDVENGETNGAYYVYVKRRR
jgi:arylsulfatase A-like enzyme